MRRITSIYFVSFCANICNYTLMIAFGCLIFKPCVTIYRFYRPC